MPVHVAHDECNPIIASPLVYQNVPKTEAESREQVHMFGGCSWWKVDGPYVHQHNLANHSRRDSLMHAVICVTRACRSSMAPVTKAVAISSLNQ